MRNGFKLYIQPEQIHPLLDALHEYKEAMEREPNSYPMESDYDSLLDLIDRGEMLSQVIENSAKLHKAHTEYYAYCHQTTREDN